MSNQERVANVSVDVDVVVSPRHLDRHRHVKLVSWAILVNTGEDFEPAGIVCEDTLEHIKGLIGLLGFQLGESRLNDTLIVEYLCENVVVDVVFHFCCAVLKCCVHSVGDSLWFLANKNPFLTIVSGKLSGKLTVKNGFLWVRPDRQYPSQNELYHSTADQDEPHRRQGIPLCV